MRTAQVRLHFVRCGPRVPDRRAEGLSSLIIISTVLILLLMLMEVIKKLRESGIEVEQVSRPTQGARVQPDAMISVAASGAPVRFAVEQKRRAPYPNELANLAERRRVLDRAGRPLLIVPFVSEVLGHALAEAGWSWADAEGNFDIRAPRLLLRQRRAATPRRRARKKIPQGSGSLAIIRALIRFGEGASEEPQASALAAQAGVSQPRASQVLHRLHDLALIERSRRGRWRPDRDALLDRFLAEYSGPGGSERYLYSLDAPSAVATLAARTHRPQTSLVVSADVGPDLVTAWRRPSVVVLYVSHEIAPAKLGLVEAQGRLDANVIVRMPEDRSVFPVPRLVATIRDVEIPLADPSQMMWDLQDLGGADRLEATGMLREWLLSLP